MDALTKIRQAGFTLNMLDDNLSVSPASQLTPAQRAFIQTHKAEIMAELRAEQVANAIIRRLVTCYSPSGLVYEVEATSPEHAEWLLRMNPKPKGVE